MTIKNVNLRIIKFVAQSGDVRIVKYWPRVRVSYCERGQLLRHFFLTKTPVDSIPSEWDLLAGDCFFCWVVDGYIRIYDVNGEIVNVLSVNDVGKPFQPLENAFLCYKDEGVYLYSYEGVPLGCLGHYNPFA